MHTIEPATEITRWLNEHPPQPGVQASTNVPEERQGKFVTVERTGGQTALLRDDATLSIDAYADNSVNAMQLARDILDSLELMAYQHPAIANIGVQSLYNNPEPDGSRQPRATLNVRLTIAPTL